MTVKYSRGGIKAQALVEVALMLPLVLLLVLGGIDFGRMYITKIVLTNAAREGANYLAYYPEDMKNDFADTYARITHEVENSGLVDTGDIIIDEPVNCCTRGDYVEVTVRVNDLELMFGNFYEQWFTNDGELDISGTVRMVVQ